MSTDTPAYLPGEAAGLKYAVVAARFNGEFADSLLKNVVENLEAAGVSPDDIECVRVPGSHEIPFAISILAEIDEHDCLIALGVLIGGDTQHHVIVGSNTSMELQRISTDCQMPVINGIIVAENRQQAAARTSGSINRGKEFALAAVAMASLRKKLVERLNNVDPIANDFPEAWEEGSDIWKS